MEPVENLRQLRAISSQANTGKTIHRFGMRRIDASWTPDFWGKIRNEVHEAQYAAQVSAADLEVEKLTEQASLAEYFFEIRGQDMLQQILNETVAADQKSLDYNQAQYDTGIGDYISVAEAKTTLESAEAAAVNVGLLRAQYEHAIAMLLGKIPTDFSIPVKPMLYAAPPIPTGVPSQLIERRPDIAAAERTLAEANATIGIGYGAFFPQVTISASGGFESSALHAASSTGPAASGRSVLRLRRSSSTAASTAPSCISMSPSTTPTWPPTARSVLNAFQQVEDYMAATRVYSQQILRQQGAVKDAQDYLNLELVRYNTGVDPYVDVVIAQTTLLSNQETLNSLQVEEMTSAVQLVQALGGGWDRTQLPTPAQAGAKTTKADYTLQQ